jgi:hypothetical protein
MQKSPFTSKKILGDPSEPLLVKKLMKTNLFKNSKQAGGALIVLSILCWVGVIFFVTLYIQENRVVTQPASVIGDLETAYGDPVLIKALLKDDEESVLDTPSDSVTSVEETSVENPDLI